MTERRSHCVRSDTPPKYQRQGPGSAVDAVEAQIVGLLREFPSMPATVIAERIGWSRGVTVLRERVRELRPLFATPDPCQRTSYRPGELAQFDLWQPDVEIPVGFGQTSRLWVVAGVSGFSRFIGGWMIPTRSAHDVLAGMLHVLAQFGALPRTFLWDREGCIGQWRQGRQRLTGELQAFRGVLGVAVRLCAPADPEAKGLVERANTMVVAWMRMFARRSQPVNWAFKELPARPPIVYLNDELAASGIPPDSPSVMTDSSSVI